MSYPPKPEIPPGADCDKITKIWDDWADKHYPFTETARQHLSKRQHPPELRLSVQLEDLRGVPPGTGRGALAWMLFRAYEQGKKIGQEKAEEVLQSLQAERRRLIQLANQALGSQLGSNKQENAAAETLIRKMLSQAPQFCSDAELSDWWKMHQYSRDIMRGRNPNRPVLSNEIKAEKQKRADLTDLDSAIGGIQAGLGF